MAAEDFLKARLRKRDRDIKQEIKRRRDANLITEGELSDIIREGVRRVLFSEEKVSRTFDPILAELKEKDLGVPENVEALVDDLILF